MVLLQNNLSQRKEEFMKNKKSRYCKQVVLNFWNFIGQTLDDKGREKIGLTDNIMLLIFKQMSDIQRGELTPSNINELGFRTNIPLDFKIKKSDLINLLREYPGCGFITLLENMDIEYVRQKHLNIIGLTDERLLDFLSSVALFEKIYFEKIDFINLGLDPSIMALFPGYKVRITLHKKEDKNYESAERARLCPFKERCGSYFDKVKGKEFERFSCSGCDFLAGEKKYLSRNTFSHGYSTKSSLENTYT